MEEVNKMEQMDANSKTRGRKDDEDGTGLLWAKKGFVSTQEHKAPPVGSLLPLDRWKRVLESTGPRPGPPVPTLAIVGFISNSQPADGWGGQVIA